jgi:hypothetical protein
MKKDTKGVISKSWEWLEKKITVIIVRNVSLPFAIRRKLVSVRIIAGKIKLATWKL